MTFVFNFKIKHTLNNGSGDGSPNHIHTLKYKTVFVFLFQTVAINKAINTQETPVKEKHLRSILFKILKSKSDSDRVVLKSEVLWVGIS